MTSEHTENQYLTLVTEKFTGQFSELSQGVDMPCLELKAEQLISVCTQLKNDSDFAFSTLIDVCGVDYSEYGIAEWRTQETTGTGFSRGVEENAEKQAQKSTWKKSRYAVVYHFLSIVHNQRLRIKVFLEEESLKIPSVTSVWPAADWYERETYDLFGIIFTGHPDLRRLLTDYGFVGHPFRKDFPLIGEVEMRYDALEKRCVYQPVSIQPRVLVPKVIREDNRYK